MENFESMSPDEKRPEPVLGEAERAASGAEGNKTDQDLTEEQAFYQAKWQRQAEAARGGTKYYGVPYAGIGLYVPPELPTASDFMHEEAKHDNEKFDKELHLEYKEWQKSLQTVLNSFKAQAAHKEGVVTPEGKPRKTLILMLGGGMKSAYSAGQALALDKMGINTNTVDVVVGASSGGVVATEFAAGSEALRNGTEMLVEALSNKEFISFAADRIWNGNMIDLQVVRRLLEDPECPYYLDQEALKASDGAELGFIVSERDPVTGEISSKIIDGKRSDVSITDLITVSMSIPNVTGDIPLIDGKEYYDGAVIPLPIKEVIAAYSDVTDILVLPQNAFDPLENLDDNWMAKLGTKVAAWRKWGFVKAGLSGRRALRESLEQIQAETGINIGILWTPEEGLHTTNIDPDQAKSGVLSSYHFAMKELEAAV